MTTYTSPYTGQTVNPSQVGYESLSISVNTVLQWPINGNSSNVVANLINVTATVASLTLAFPAATEVSTGTSVIITNIGANTFVVTDTSGNTIVSISSGISQFIYLTDNSTQNGTWSTVQFGAGTSAANAATLAGYGLTAIGATLNTSTTPSTFSSAYTLLTGDRSSIYVWTGGTGAITLPSTSTVGSGWYVIIKNNGTGLLTITPSGSDTIDSAANAELQLAESFVVVSSGSTWYSYAYGRSATFFFTQLTKNVTGGTVTLSVVEAANIIQEYQGALLSNCTVYLPATVQLYSLSNNTTGAYTLTFTTGLGTTLALTQGQTIIAICDGTNVYNSQTATSSTITALTLGNGSAAAPSLSFTGDATTGLYLAASNQLGFAANGANAATLKTTGLFVPVGIVAGAF